MTASISEVIASELRDDYGERFGYYFSDIIENVDDLVATKPIQSLRATLFRLARINSRQSGMDVRDVLVNYGLSDREADWVLDLS